jgi:hypothetical protein
MGSLKTYRCDDCGKRRVNVTVVSGRDLCPECAYRRASLKFEVLALAFDKENESESLEASIVAESLEDALEMIRQWVAAGQIRGYGTTSPQITFEIRVRPTETENLTTV